MNLKSIRWRLPLTYAGIALITALVLGGTLLAILRSYYQDQELNYLQKNAIAISDAVSPFINQNPTSTFPADLKSHLVLLAFLSQTRVRLLNAQGTEMAAFSFIEKNDPRVIVSALSLPKPDGLVSAYPTSPLDDLNAPEALDATIPSLKDIGPGLLAIRISQPVEHAVPVPDKSSGVAGQVKIISVPDKEGTILFRGSAEAGGANQAFFSEIPAVGTMYGFSLQGNSSAIPARSNQVYRQAIQAANGTVLGSIELSDGPAYGSDIVTAVARGWLVSSLVGIFIAVLAGWWISRHMSMPLLALTDTTLRMAKGDLTVRVDPRQTAQGDEIGSLGRAFNEMADRVEAMVSTLKCFASDAAHELRTPLTALHTNLDLLSGENAGAESSAPIMEQVWQQVQRLERLTGDLLDLSRLEMGTNEPSAEEVELRALLREVCEPYASRAEQAEIDFKVVLPGEAGETSPAVILSARRAQLGRALGNLLDNALKFTGAGGRVTAGLSCGSPVETDSASDVGQTNKPEADILLWVEDTGIGIPEDDLPYLFNRFHRARNATAYTGSGLGLAIVKAIVERHGGLVSVQSSAEGTRVEMRLPAAPPADFPAEPGGAGDSGEAPPA